MSDDPTNEELQKQIEMLEQQLDELHETLTKVLKIKDACQNMAQKLATKYGEPLADWWWLH